MTYGTISRRMLRRINYRTAANAFIFTALWFVIGAIALWSPVPGALGIAGEMFAAWLVLFFVIMSAAGSLLTVAALNAAFPPQPAAPPRDRAMPARSPLQGGPSAGAPMWAPPASSASTSRGGAAQRRKG